MALFTAESYLQMDDANPGLPLFTMGEDNLRIQETLDETSPFRCIRADLRLAFGIF